MVTMSRKSSVLQSAKFVSKVLMSDIDKERDALRADLSGSKCVEKLDEAIVTEPMTGHNSIGNPFFTDGKALVVSLRCSDG
jgi:LssY C-terminus